RFRARAGGGLVLDVRTGEILAMASLPDFDPHNRPDSNDPALFNRMTMGVYELGSVFKTFTIAMALETGTVTLADGYDASEPIRVGRFLIRDDHPQGRYLTIPEIFVHSSNIGAAKLALDVGTDTERRFLDRLGLLRRASIELPEVGRPLLPDHWRELATMTIAYGHGIAVSPLQAATAFAAIVNGGYLTPATLIAKDPGEEVNRVPILSPATSARMRELLRLAVTEGTGRQADVPGYRVGGKTGTAEKPRQGGYAKSALLSSFIGVFPIDDPRYVVFVMLDEPQGTEATFHYASAGWTAAPTVAQIILRTAPLLGVQPAPEDRGLYHQAALLIRDRGEVP
ncbi:MAG: peptidoglycan D,D-transpeptidase FtsI family protein, partial [Rhodothalassiaceae bacterium]